MPYPHHVIQRGNNRQPIFLAQHDYAVFLKCLREAKRTCRTRLYAYVLMTNHVHLLVEPEQEGGQGRFMQSVGRRYVRYFNDAHGRTGTLWEGRFKSAVVSRDEYLKGRVVGSDVFQDEIGHKVGRRLKGERRGGRNGLIAML